MFEDFHLIAIFTNLHKNNIQKRSEETLKMIKLNDKKLIFIARKPLAMCLMTTDNLYQSHRYVCIYAYKIFYD